MNFIKILYFYFLTEFLEIIIILNLILMTNMQNIQNEATKILKSQYIEIYDNKGKLIDKIGSEIIIIEIELIPINVIKALIAVEDKNFFQHKGVDYKSLFKNLYINILNKKVIAGGSTISQQLAKNILQNQSIFSTTDKTLLRKIKELILTYKIEKQYTKSQILYLYLNRVFFGKNCFGIEAASQMYFNKNTSSLNLYESALLIGLLQSPSKYSSDIEAWRTRARTVLKRMKNLNFITEEEEQNFEKFKIPKININETNIKFFINYVLQQIPKNCLDKDIKIKTTFDSELYKKANKSLKETQEELGEEWQSDEGSFILIAKDGAIKVLIGGLDYASSNFNIAVNSKRPSGSISKYYTYLTAIEMGLNPKSLIDDSPYSFGTWEPSNFLHKTVGEVQVDVAFAQSINSVAVRIIEAIKPKKVIETIRKLEIIDPAVSTLSLTLGGFNTSLLNLTKSFLPIANKGCLSEIYCIEEIEDLETRELLYKHKKKYTKILDERTCYYMWEMMKRTVSQYGTGRKIKIKNGYFGGKSGTSNQNKDLYFVLLNKNFCIGCWYGRKDFKAMTQNFNGHLCITAINKFLEQIEVSSEDLYFDITLEDLNKKHLIDLMDI
ncbi:transglycosylase domain-containing protein [Alphaproteobacteria bacterium endosymbiont of Tiliacea citrago]|uniref:transglycosylase domain-containing protein n=1 Tax=Alphaproteobacteria bacterium endosymbiont of Tiliacea citrago TaxID=3077944 RepID=UPI00313B57F8